MNPVTNITAGLPDLAALNKPASGVAETKQFEQTLANVLGQLMSQTSSSQDSEESPVVPTGSDIMPLQLALILGQIKEAK